MMSVMSAGVHIPVHLDTDRPTKDVEFNEVRLPCPSLLVANQA